MFAGFSQVDITPPLGTEKIGWIRSIIGTKVRDRLYARAAVFDNGNSRLGFIQLDTLSIRWTQANQIRQGITQRYNFPGQNVMVAATHNHAGPAVANLGQVKRDEGYIKSLVEKAVTVFGEALAIAQEAKIGFGHTYQWQISKNRRTVMRDGTVKTNHSFSDPQALYLEGPIDPEVAVVAASGPNGKLLGCIVNFTCHSVDFGDSEYFSAGYPGVLASEMKKNGCPVTLFLDGASGNISMFDAQNENHCTMGKAGKLLAEDVVSILADMKFRKNTKLYVASKTIQLPFREPTENQIKGTVKGAQRFTYSDIYDSDMPALVERIRSRGTNPAQIQVLSMDEIAFIGIPAEYFVEYGLDIKQRCFPIHALLVGHANGMVGYVPTPRAFDRGGYETTFASSSRLAPEAGDILADTAVELTKRGH